MDDRDYLGRTWLTCPTCQNILQADECALCGADVGDRRYLLETAPGSDHLVGPLCSLRCKARLERAESESGLR